MPFLEYLSCFAFVVWWNVTIFVGTLEYYLIIPWKTCSDIKDKDLYLN